ncbi:hypothetical protein E2542_SST08600 [Spatholobus suberectus]|nr:hypothetical protein E2542_SST08600 [Spatholobus suberectus]
MKEEMGSEETNVPSKPSSRRASSDAGRETAYGWQLHRSPSPSPCVTEKETIVKGNNSTNEIDVSMSSNAQYCYYILEAMPQPGPTWSTTGPSVLAKPTPTPSAPIIEAPLRVEWGESQDSSCAWWLGYVEGFDDNMTIEKLDPPFVENVVMENSKGPSYESTFVDAIDISYCCPDDWLAIPTMEQDFGDIVMP